MAQKTAATRCSHIATCELFPKFVVRGSLKVWVTFYCEASYANCARYKLTLANRPVPVKLLPNGRELELSNSVE